MAENKSSRILGTEYLQGRPVLHVQFSEQVPGLGEMNTHHWMDKETWMPMRTEYYNVKGELKLVDQITSYIKDLTIEPEKDFRPEQDDYPLIPMMLQVHG